MAAQRATQLQLSTYSLGWGKGGRNEKGGGAGPKYFGLEPPLGSTAHTQL